MKQKTNIIVYTILILFLITIDQFTKYLAVINLKGHSPVVIIDGVFELLYLENEGAAFGILQQRKVLLIGVTSLLLIALIWFLIRIPYEKKFNLLKIILILFISGAVGNLIDRIRYNYVVDFFYFKPINFPVFNVADIYVTTAAAAFAIAILFFYKEEELNRILPRFSRK